MKGRGYAISSEEELKFVQQVAAATGIVLDPVYRCVTTHGVLLLSLLAPCWL